ncbi:MAG: hypothetical protein PHP83_00090 [Clostridia bacterium]|nr:hypothetical protein [Clostridia bacterium]
MDNEWKHKLINECENYLLDVDKFKDKWCNGKIEKLVNKLIDRAKDKINERNLLLKKAFDYYEQRLIEISKGTIKSKFIKSQLLNINNEKEAEEADNIFNYITNLEKQTIIEYINDYLQFAINSNERKKYQLYPLLMLTLSMSGGFQIGIPYRLVLSKKFSIIDSSFSKYCQVESIPLFINRQSFDLIIEAINYDTASVKIKHINNGYIIDTANDNTKDNLYVLNEEFVHEIIKDLKENDYTSAIDFSLNIAKKYKLPIDDSILDFKKLYEEKPEQILISDQRYYAEKKLEQDKEQAKEDRRQRQEHAEEDRRQRQEDEEYQRRISEENRIRAVENEERYRRQQMMDVEQDRRYRDEQQRALQKQNEQQIKAQKAQTRAFYDAQIAQLRKEEFNLHGPNDARRLLAVRSQIRDLQWKRDHE